MDSHRSAKSHATAWVLAVVAVPVLYVLSVPPVVYCTSKHSGTFRAPSWAELYAAPYVWVMEKSPPPIKDNLWDYLRWWQAKVFPR